ncbi:hypothetical protein GLA29479_3702 [Lysobacter antibioticus]|uniref:hypothetical protein n=1 Tax=Lysobacter antibioticus TaxID=84531 RepID=UPI0007203AE7|nr:hypothetical protein [Lysobacter antibioticus]ALN64553.1 hypothetical protein GLA29479_3702 [Lysobacter antibioticus]
MKFARLSTAAGIGMALMVTCTAKAAEAEAPSLSTALNLILKEGRPLPALEMLRTGVESGRFPAATSAQFYAISGDAIGTAQMNDRGGKSSQEESLPPLPASWDARPAVAEIVRASTGKQVVMLNEDHYHQLHRAFGLLLLKELRKAGFTHFGAETFGSTLQESMADGAPDLRTGVYTTDPLYADMTRQAAALGYSLFDYEQRPDQESNDGSPEDQRLARERAQAKNIAAILNGDPTARIFIYAGSGHIAESTEPDGREWMALMLKKEHGIDPLTVNQVLGTPRSRSELDSALYRSVGSALSSPSVLQSTTGMLTVPGFDIVVFHPRQLLSDGRPTWLGMNGYRSPCRVQFKPNQQPSLIRAFVASEEPRAIPMDQVLISSGAKEVTLMLPVGRYRLVRETLEGNRALGDAAIQPSKGASDEKGGRCLQFASKP